MDYFERKEVLIIPLCKCPEFIQDEISKFECRGDPYMSYFSEFQPAEDKDWSDTLTIEHIENYYKNQCERTDWNIYDNKSYAFQGTLEEFIKFYGLTIDKWLIETGYDFKGIKEILFNIRW